MHLDYVDDEDSQSANSKAPKCHFDALECTLEEVAILELILKNPKITQKEMVLETGKSRRTVQRIMETLRDDKKYIRRVGGKRYGSWEILV